MSHRFSPSRSLVLAAAAALLVAGCPPPTEAPPPGVAVRCEADADCADRVTLGPCERAACSADGLCHASADADVDGQPCEDGDRCTSGETCSEGVCGGGDLRDCSALDSGCVMGVCEPASGLCVPTAARDGLACDDGDACTEVDACRQGSCVGEFIDCSALTTDCLVGTCAYGACVAAPADTPGCDGSCGSAGDCPHGPCEEATCVDGACVVTPLDDVPCDDGDTCTLDDACVAGTCQPGAALSCDDPVPGDCWTRVCAAGGCQDAPDVGASCDDGVACTISESCQADGSCGGGALNQLECGCLTEADCDDGLDCTEDVCTLAGNCSNPPVAGTCAIDGVCYGAGEPDPSGPCACEPSADPTTWKCADCGDGIVDLGEACDDGDAVAGDGCDMCQQETMCLVGVLQSGGTSALSTLAVSPTGELTEVATLPTTLNSNALLSPSFGAGGHPLAVCGRHLFVAAEPEDAIHAYAVDLDGSLSALPDVAAAIERPVALACDQDSDLLVVASEPEVPCLSCVAPPLPPRNYIGVTTYRVGVDGALTQLDAVQEAVLRLERFDAVTLVPARSEVIVNMTALDPAELPLFIRVQVDPMTGTLTRRQGPVYRAAQHSYERVRMAPDGAVIGFASGGGGSAPHLMPVEGDGTVSELTTAKHFIGLALGPPYAFNTDILWLGDDSSELLVLSTSAGGPWLWFAATEGGATAVPDGTPQGLPVPADRLFQTRLYGDVVVYWSSGGDLGTARLGHDAAGPVATPVATLGVNDWTPHDVIACPAVSP